MKEQYLVFYHGKRELVAYTLRGTFPGEVGSTVELLSAEHGIPKQAIRVACEMRENISRCNQLHTPV